MLPQRDANVGRTSRTRIINAADLPTAYKRVGDSAEFVAFAFADWQFIKSGDISAVANVKSVVTEFFFKTIRILRRLRFVRSGSRDHCGP